MNPVKDTLAKIIWDIIGGLIIIGILAFLALQPRKDNDHDMRYVEIQVELKEITEINDEAVYLIHTTDRNGNAETFQITNLALADRFEEAQVYKEIKTGKYYKLRIAEREEYGSYYPSICGAVTLIDGFPPETAASSQ